MSPIIHQIKCPYCGKGLSVPEQPDLENKKVICPGCGQKSLFANCRKVVAPPPIDESKTEINISGNIPLEPGSLIESGTRRTHRLSMGRNVIGRAAPTSSANIQIDTMSKRLSREHLVVEVKMHPERGVIHYASLYKEHVNPTRVGVSPIVWGEIVILNEGDVVHLPDVDLVFQHNM